LKRTWHLSCSADGDTYDLRFGIGVHTIGSAATSDLRVSDLTVSRSHARLTCSNEGVTVEDLGSTNGTAIDGKPVDGAVLITDRAKLKLGRLVFELGPLQADESPDRLYGTESSSGASMLLGPATVGFLRDAGEEVGAGEGDVIVRRGEHQEFFYVVIEGESSCYFRKARAAAVRWPGLARAASSVQSRCSEKRAPRSTRWPSPTYVC